MNFQRKKREKVDITLISMIDVLFVLLLFFMVSTTFTRKTEVNIKLPDANGQPADAHVKMITLVIDAAGAYALSMNDEPPRSLSNSEITTLKQELQQYVAQSKELPFVINADAKTPHQSVINALEAAGEVGFTHITFAAIRPKKAP